MFALKQKKNLIQELVLFCLWFSISLEANPLNQGNCPPPIPDNHWQTSTTLDSEFDSKRLCDLIEQVKSDSSEYHSFLIERHGKLIAEVYNTRKDKPFNKRYGLRLPFDGETAFDANTLHDVRSVSKSVTSLLFGMAVDKKIIEGVNFPVLSSYPELSIPKEDPRYEITWKHLLTMSSGLDWEEWRYGFLFSDETRLLWKKDIAEFIFDRDVIHKPGTQFKYNGGGTSLLSDLLIKKTGKSLKEIANDWLFEPLEIQNFEWVEDRNGRALAHAGLRLKPRDMLKLGRLVLNGGVWKGKRIISKHWLNESFTRHIDSGITIFRFDGISLGYGYQWWLGESILGEKKIPWSLALGNGGQLIFIIPSLDMVIVTTAGGYGDPTSIQKIVGLVDQILFTVK